MKKFGLMGIIIAMIMGALIFNAPVVSASASGYLDTNIAIEQLDIVANLSLKNEVRLVEDIDVRFINTRSVFVRSLPLFSYVTKEVNGQIKSMRYNLNYDVHKIEDGNGMRLPFEEVEENGYLFLELGKDGSLMYPSGSLKTFVFDYTVRLGNDRIEEYDEFYYNIIGTDWACNISNISWQVNFPENVDGDLYVYVGAYGETNTPNQTLSVVDKTVSGTWSSLSPYNGITVRTVLPQGYFSQMPRPDLFVPILVVMLGALATLMVILKQKYSNKYEVTPVVEFVAPENIDPCEAGFAFDGRINAKDIASLIVYWANKGYLTINEDDKIVTLTKVVESAEQTDMKSYEKVLFSKLFAFGKTTTIKTTDVGVAEAMQTLKLKLKASSLKTYFNHTAIRVQMLVAAIGAFCLGMPIAYAHWMMNTEISIFTGFVMFGLGALINFLAIERKFHEYSFKSTIFLVLGILAIVLTGGMLFVFQLMLNGETFGNPILLIASGIVAFVISVFLTTHFSTREQSSSKIIGSLLGLKQFIKVAEKDRLEMMVHENPKAFYEILPFAYVLDVSDVWIKKFESIVVANPSWMSSSSSSYLDTIIILSVLNRMSRNLQTTMASRPSNTSGSGGGFGGGGFGGGFSGGGFGGGGGFSR